MGEALDNHDWKEDVTGVFIPFCQEQIKYHQNNIRKLKAFSWFEVLLGVGLTVLAFIIFRTDTAKISETFFKLGPMLVFAPFPAFQFRMIVGSQQALSSYLIWKGRFQSALDKDTPPPEWLIKVVTENMAEVAKPTR